MKLFSIFKKKQEDLFKPQTYNDRLLSLVRLGCSYDTIEKIKARFLSSDDLDCLIIFVIFANSLANDFKKLTTLVESAYKNALKDKQKRNVQFHALQIVEAFKKLK